MKGLDLTSLKTTREVRVAIDTIGARCAAHRVAEGADSRPLLEAFKPLGQAAQVANHHDFAEADLHLHACIIELARVQSLSDVSQSLLRYYDLFHRIETLQLLWPDLSTLCEWHRRIVDAICAGDANRAEEVTKAHFEASSHRLASRE